MVKERKKSFSSLIIIFNCSFSFSILLHNSRLRLNAHKSPHSTACLFHYVNKIGTVVVSFPILLLPLIIYAIIIDDDRNTHSLPNKQGHSLFPSFHPLPPTNCFLRYCCQWSCIIFYGNSYAVSFFLFSWRMSYNNFGGQMGIIIIKIIIFQYKTVCQPSEIYHFPRRKVRKYNMQYCLCVNMTSSKLFMYFFSLYSQAKRAYIKRILIANFSPPFTPERYHFLLWKNGYIPSELRQGRIFGSILLPLYISSCVLWWNSSVGHTKKV